ncbi:hypothetical protein [Cutibacterium modestum]|uniref:hypothetical protein n=1 Tax=Cutibacterium modestum TaxID=2559073 RepID=UPI000F05C25B
MNGLTGEGNNGCEEILAFLVVGIGGIALLKKMAPKIIGHLGAWLRDHGLLGVPGQGLFDLGLLGSVSASHLVVAVGVLIVVGALGAWFAGWVFARGSRGCR